jgi:uncharacterized protein
MKTRTILSCLTALLLTLAALSPAVAPAPARADALSDLKESFRARFPTLERLKAAGKIGETSKGYVEAVKPEHLNDAEVKKTVNDENADRMKLYKIIAEQQKTTPEKVAVRNAVRNFENAKKGEWLKGDDGAWKQKG